MGSSNTMVTQAIGNQKESFFLMSENSISGKLVVRRNTAVMSQIHNRKVLCIVIRTLMGTRRTEVWTKVWVMIMGWEDTKPNRGSIDSYWR
ncbi:hypothetical protein MFRU_002g03750 [Monilinia fructicola]|nr:hypothetical protein MFRU_002g03750 [Monilinia fructicola]